MADAGARQLPTLDVSRIRLGDAFATADALESVYRTLNAFFTQREHEGAVGPWIPVSGASLGFGASDASTWVVNDANLDARYVRLGATTLALAVTIATSTFTLSGGAGGVTARLHLPESFTAGGMLGDLARYRVRCPTFVTNGTVVDVNATVVAGDRTIVLQDAAAAGGGFLATGPLVCSFILVLPINAL